MPETLTQLAARIDDRRRRVLKAFDEAGPEFDLTKVREFDGTPAQKLDQIRQADRELNDLQQLVEARFDLVGTRLPSSEPKRARKNIGRSFVESDAWKRRGSQGTGDGATAELDLGPEDFGIGVKTLTTTFSTSFEPYAGTGIVEPLGVQVPNLADVIPTVPLDHWRTRYLTETAVTDAAGQVAEGDVYPEAALNVSEQLKRLKKVGVILPATEELLDDDATAESYVNARLTLFVREQVDAQLLAGDGTGQNLLGFHAAAGVNTNTYAAGGNAQAKIAAILAGAGLIATNGKAVADTVVINATDWWGLLGTQDNTGEFLFEPGEPPTSFFGLRPVVTVNETAGRFLTGAMAHATLFVRRGVEIAVSREHNDYFVRGEIAIRAKLPAWLAILRPAAFTSTASA